MSETNRTSGTRHDGTLLDLLFLAEQIVSSGRPKIGKSAVLELANALRRVSNGPGWVGDCYRQIAGEAAAILVEGIVYKKHGVAAR